MLNQKDIQLTSVKSIAKKGNTVTIASGTYKGKPFVGGVMKFGPLFEGLEGQQNKKRTKAS